MSERLIVFRRKQKHCARNLDSLGRAFPMDRTNSGDAAAALQTHCGVRELPAGAPAFVRRIHCRFPDANDMSDVSIRIKIKMNGDRLSALLLSGLLLLPLATNLGAATLTGSFSPIASGSNVNLTTLGKLDWVQWGLGGDYAVNRKASVTPLISNFTLITQFGSVFSSPYWLEDTGSSYCSWSDGHPVVSITSNYTRVMAYGYPLIAGSGFRITVPADTTANILSVFVGSASARGQFRANLSGVPMYSHSPLESTVNGVYTITYAANSPGQTLTVEWTLPLNQTNGYVMLQAAALTAPGANNPPFALLTHPAADTTYVAPADIVFNASAQDFDGTVTNVSFYANSNKLGQSATNLYNFTWNNAPVGYYQLTAVATDDSGGSRASVPVEVFVHGTNGSQTGAVAFPPAAVDLTAEGTADWVHWGLETSASVNRKAGVPARISDFTPLGTANLLRYADNHSAYSWSDGLPTTATNGTTTGVFLTNLSSGFQLTVSADETPRVLRLYVGAYAARGRLLAYLSDFSAQPYIDTSIYDASWDSEHAVYSIAYRAASPGQELTVIYRSVELLDGVWGNVTLQAATLQGETVSVGQLAVTSAGDLISSGTVGGPFSPSSIIYTLTNSGDLTLDWTASKAEAWVSLSATSGSLAAGDSTTVTVSLNSAADSLAAGSYSDTVSFANTTTGSGNTSRSVSLTVNTTGQLAVIMFDPIHTATDFRFSFATQADRDYVVQATDTLSPPDWTNVTTVPGTGGTVTVTNHNLSPTQQYYRVITE
jgi:hypothetical protein